jgi:hypothetical protein
LVYPSHVLHYLLTHFEVIATEAWVHSSWANDFLVLFRNIVVANRALHHPIPSAGDFLLIFRRWRWQSHMLFSPLCYNVLLAIDNLLVHI